MSLHLLVGPSAIPAAVTSCLERRPWGAGRPSCESPRRVHERSQPESAAEPKGDGSLAPGTEVLYEAEGGERTVRGSVEVGAGRWWSVALVVPDDPPGSVFVHARRHGASPVGHRGDAAVEIELPTVELEAFVALLVGVAAQARDRGVLPVTSTVRGGEARASGDRSRSA